MIKIISILLIIMSIVLNSVHAADDITVFFNDKKIEFGMQPRIIDGYTMVPIRTIFEALGYEVKWIHETQSIVAQYNDDVITMFLDKNDLFVGKLSEYNNAVNKNEYLDKHITQIEKTPQKIDGKIFIPIRIISEASGYEVSWDQEEKVIRIGFVEKNIESGDGSKQYYDPTTNIQQIQHFIESGLYLEAMQNCEQTQSWHNISPEDSIILSNLYKLSEEKYNEYLQNRTIKLEYGAPEQYTAEYHITPEQVIDAIYEEYGITVSHTMTGSTLFWFEGEGMRFTVPRWYCKSEIYIDDLEIEEYVTCYNAVNELRQIRSYIEQGLYLEAINLCNSTIYNHVLSFSDQNLFLDLRDEAQKKYDLYVARQKEINLNKTVKENQKKVIYNTVKLYVSSILRSSATAIWPDYRECTYRYTEEGQILSTGTLEAMNAFGGYGKVNFIFLFDEDMSVAYWDAY